MTKKILIVISSLGGGGAERVASMLSNYFCYQGNNVKICYWNDSESQYEVDEGVSIFKLNPKVRVYTLSKEIKLFQPDVILSFTDVANVISYCAKLLSKSKAKYIPSVHNNLKERDKHIAINFKFKLLKVLHRLACNKSDKVVVVSEDARQSFVNYYNIPHDKCVCIYNPIYSKVKLNNEKNKSDILRIVTVGRLTQQKNYPLLLDVAEELKNKGIDFCIDVYGDGELKCEIESIIKNKNLSMHVKLKGFSSEMVSLLKEYDLYIMTSKWEGLPLVLLEALHSGLPIISTDCPSGPREILGHGDFGTLVPMGGGTDISNAIVNGTYKKKLNPERLKVHLELFTLDNIGSDYLHLFNRVCDLENE